MIPKGSRVLETRTRKGMRWRRYRTPDGVDFTTFEVPAILIPQFSAARLAELLGRAQRTLERKQRNALIQRLRSEGWKPLAIAHELGVSVAHVHRRSTT